MFSAELKYLLFQLSIQIYPIPFTKGWFFLLFVIMAFWNAYELFQSNISALNENFDEHHQNM